MTTSSYHARRRERMLAKGQDPDEVVTLPKGWKYRSFSTGQNPRMLHIQGLYDYKPSPLRAYFRETVPVVCGKNVDYLCTWSRDFHYPAFMLCPDCLNGVREELRVRELQEALS